MIHLVLRFDDPSACSNHALEAAVFDILERKGISITVAAIPCLLENGNLHPLTAANAAHMIEALRTGIIEIAQHGYAHERHGMSHGGQPSEFTGQSLEQQRDLIDKGRSVLQGITGCKINGFVPPWNAIDATTVSILEDLGFDYVSAGADVRDNAVRLRSLPRTCQMTDVRQVVTLARRYAWMNPVVIAAMHHYDFKESGSSVARISLQDFEATLEWIKQQGDVRVLTLSGLATAQNGASTLGSLFAVARCVPWRIRRLLPARFLIPLPRLLSFLH